ncbi:MAG: 50S ribosomal protein L32 [Anaerolineae bacterium]|nr:50S ribosomal protein L32 [Anaerolineae bacterium]
MGPLPKRKASRRRKRNRRAHDALTTKHLVKCDNCGGFKPSHVVCTHCGHYNGRMVFEIEDTTAS